MTSDDRLVDADNRAALANNNKADLFISLHANASPRPLNRGATVFYLGLDRFGEEARRQAQEQRELLPVFGGGDREIALVQWELAQARYVDESAVLAGIVEEKLKDQVPVVSNHAAPMRVLAGANMPAVLIELGYLSTPEEEQTLASGDFQNRIAQTLVEAVIAFNGFIEQGAGAGHPRQDLPARNHRYAARPRPRIVSSWSSRGQSLPRPTHRPKRPCPADQVRLSTWPRSARGRVTGRARTSRPNASLRRSWLPQWAARVGNSRDALRSVFLDRAKAAQARFPATTTPHSIVNAPPPSRHLRRADLIDGKLPRGSRNQLGRWVVDQ